MELLNAIIAPAVTIAKIPMKLNIPGVTAQMYQLKKMIVFLVIYLQEKKENGSWLEGLMLTLQDY